MRALTALLLLTVASIASAQQHPRDPELQRETKDPDTLAWWHTTEALSNDSMQGRDTGTPAYQHAADYVADRFRAAGLTPAGDHATFFQTVALHQLDIPTSTLKIERPDGSSLPLRFLYDYTQNPTPNGTTQITGALTFRGYCGKDAMADIRGKVVFCFGTQRHGLPSNGERTTFAQVGGAAAIVNVDDTGFTIEPPRWPYAYARTVTFANGPLAQLLSVIAFRLNAASFAGVIAGSGQDAAAILIAGGAQQPLPSFDIPAKLTANWQTTAKDISSPNVLATLPGSDPVLKNEYIVVAAHLDGYGFGTPVAGDKLYNGALDDAAYVALLIQFADNLHRDHIQLKRSILFCAFTGEEKGLLGSNYFVQHPTIPLSALAADINLDQLRPLFPLHILTALAVDDTSLGATAREVGRSMSIEIRPDREPERGLLRRADHYPFLKAGIPSIGFIFGYDPGTDAERRYREWYQIRYHRPQDDLTQPIDFAAATTFDHFFYRLTETLANTPTRPTIYPTSPFAAKPGAHKESSPLNPAKDPQVYTPVPRPYGSSPSLPH